MQCISMASSALLLHFVPLTNDAVAVALLVLYCTGRFLKKKSEHI